MRHPLIFVMLAVSGLLGCIERTPIDEGGSRGEQTDLSVDNGLADAGLDAAVDMALDACADTECDANQICVNGACSDQGDTPEINVSPAMIDFGRVLDGEVNEQSVTITNIGDARLDIAAIEISGSADIRVWLGDVDLRDRNLPSDPDGDGRPGVQPGQRFVLTVRYAPAVDGPDEARIRITSNDPRRPTVEMSIRANGAGPCLSAQPEAAAFESVPIGRTATRVVRLESCGSAPVEIEQVFIREGSAPEFSLSGGLDLPLRLAAVVPDEPPDAVDIPIEFSPQEIGEYAGTLVVVSRDPNRPRIETTLVGLGALNDCPVAVVGDARIEIVPGEVVELDASASTDADGPDGRPVRYQWAVIQAPDGSTAAPVERFEDPRRPRESGIPDDPGTPQALFHADIAGSYTLALTVTDAEGLTAPSGACAQPPAVVQIEALYESDIHVEMVWNTPEDEDQTDAEGTDVDLHLRHPLGRNWSQAPLDCYSANPAPDWGPLGPDSNPELLIDDTNGAGPEAIGLDMPEDTGLFNGGGYRVGVLYYRADNFADARNWGPSEATVRIYLQGRLAGEWVGRLEDTNHFWEVAEIIWTAEERRVVEINEHFPRQP